MALSHRANRGNLNSMYKGIIYQYKIGEKYYVGKTYGPERKRKDKHKYEAYKLMSDRPFQRAIRKYGWEVVESGYSVIETIEDCTKEALNERLIEREAYWIKERNSLVPNGYNVFKSGQIQVPHQKDPSGMYRKISESLKGKYLNCESTSRKVFCVEQARWYPSVSEAGRQCGIDISAIQKAATGKVCKAGGFSWNYDGSHNTREDKIKNSRKPIACVETGKEYESVYAAAVEMWGDDASKRKCRIQASLKNGWAVNGKHFKYIEHDNPVLSETEV